MIDLLFLRENTEKFVELVKKKEPGFNSKLLINLDVRARQLKLDVEGLRQKRNELAKQGQSGVTEQLREQSKKIGKELKEKEFTLKETEQAFEELYLRCPNLLHFDVPDGGKESNQVVKEVGQKPKSVFAIKNHVELGKSLGWLDFEIASVLSGSNFAFYKDDAVKLIYALTMFMLKNNMEYGFKMVLPPYLVTEESLTVSSNFPKFKDQVYSIPEDDLYLTPTAEVNLANLYRNKILLTEQLPIRHTAWTSCFRREAGTYGSTERGLIRIHQFEKVELFSLSEPEKSFDELDLMIACAENILQKLDLHYRVSLLAAQDCSFASAKTYDIEVWLPGQNAYYEVSSCSNCTDFQARRGLIRYKEKSGNQSSLVHTLNGSSLAIPRLMVAIMETYQQEDGSLEIPEFLRKEALFS